MSDEDPIVNGTPLSALRVVDLKEELDKHGLSKLGNKSVLADRLREFLLNGTRESVSPTKSSPQKDKSESPVKSPASENPIIAAYRAKQQAALQEAQKEKASETARTVSESGDSANASFDENSKKEDSKEKEDSDSETETNEVSNNNGDKKDNERLEGSSTSSPKSKADASENDEKDTSRNDSESKDESKKAKEPTEKSPESSTRSSEPAEVKTEEKAEIVEPAKEEVLQDTSNATASPVQTNTVKEERNGEQEELELDYGDADEAEPEKDEVLEEKPVSEKQPTEVNEVQKTSKLNRNVSPCRYPEDSVIVIRGLMRPFTKPQLQSEIKLGNGEIVDFWIDDKRSYCIVEMRSIEEAKEVRERMRGIKWPVSSQKTLSVHFDNKQNLERHKSGVVGNDKVSAPATTSRTISSDQERPKLSGLPGRNLSLRVTLESAVRDNSKHDQEKTERLVEGRREKEREREVEKRNIQPSRPREETDRKRRRSETPPRERKRERLEDTRQREKEERVEKEQPKNADELFLKTKTTPHIYYLPATEEEAKIRAAKREADAKREAERLSRRR